MSGICTCERYLRFRYRKRLSRQLVVEIDDSLLHVEKQRYRATVDLLFVVEVPNRLGVTSLKVIKEKA